MAGTRRAAKPLSPRDAAAKRVPRHPGNHVVRKVDRDGIISTFAGDGTDAGTGDGGLATAAGIGAPWRSRSARTALYVADDVDHRVRRIGPDGIVTSIAGVGVPTGIGAPNGECGPAVDATLKEPGGLALWGGKVDIAERDGRVRVVVL